MSPEPLRHFKERLPRRKAVTIALGFLCSDGIVLCTDRQITVEGGLKYQERKSSYMTGLFAGVRFTLASVYAGDPEAVKIMRTEIRERLGGEIAKSKLNGFEAPKARKALEKIFSSRHAKHLQMLIGIRFYSGETCLFKTVGRKVLDAHTEYIGAGDSSALRYLADVALPSHVQSVSEAQILGAYLVSVANRYVDGCSGGPDLLRIAQTDGMIKQWHGIPNEREMFGNCEEEIGRRLRELLYSNGHFKPLASQRLALAK